MADTTSSNQGATTERSYVAEIVAAFSLLGITVLSTVVLVKNSGDKDMVRYVFASVIPLLGSWMGTILAFYFSRDNLAAATQSVKDLTQAVTGADKLKTIQVKDKMRPLKDITYEQVTPGDEDKKKLSDLVQKFKDVERIPILNSQLGIRFLIYKGMIDKYLAQFSQGKNLPEGKQVADLTLKDLLDSDPATKKLFESSFAFVAQTATLADAKHEIHVIGALQDFEARSVANTIATSPLVKTAFYGGDANWGRILAAAGRSEAHIEQNKIPLIGGYGERAEYHSSYSYIFSASYGHYGYPYRSNYGYAGTGFALGIGLGSPWFYRGYPGYYGYGYAPAYYGGYYAPAYYGPRYRRVVRPAFAFYGGPRFHRWGHHHRW